VSEELSKIISEKPIELPDLLRAVRGLTADQLRRRREEADRLKKVATDED
jgi:hypothetical protein